MIVVPTLQIIRFLGLSEKCQAFRSLKSWSELSIWSIVGDQYNAMDSSDLKSRSMQFGIRIIALFQSLPGTVEAQIIGKQLLRSATSIAANYRAAGRGRSRAEFFAKICIVVEEADETLYWLELIRESKIFSDVRLEELLLEANELVRIFSATRKTTRENMSREKSLNHQIIKSQNDPARVVELVDTQDLKSCEQ